MMQPDDAALVKHHAPFDLIVTLRRVEAAIAAAGLPIFARVDHVAIARDAGLNMPAATVLVHGPPIGGAPLMLAAPHAGLDLPSRVLVPEEDGRLRVAVHPAAPMLRRAGVSSALAARHHPTQQLLIAALEA